MGLSVIPTWDELEKRGQGIGHGSLGSRQGSLFGIGTGRVSSWSSSSSSSSLSSSFNSDSMGDLGSENTEILSMQSGDGTKALCAGKYKEPINGCKYSIHSGVICQDMKNVQNVSNVKSSLLQQQHRGQLPYLAHQGSVLRSVFADDVPTTPSADMWLHKFL